MEDKIRISGIIFDHGNNDYALWEGFSLTDEEENAIMEILMNHDTEGYSIRGTRQDIAKEIGEWMEMSINSVELAKRICDCLSDGYDDEENRDETEIALYNELSQVSNDSFIKAALLRLCEKIEELEEN